MTETAEGAQDAATTEEKFSIRDAANELRELFDALQPPDRIRLKDGFGGAYIVPALIVGSAQLRIMRRLRELGDVIDVDAVREGGAKAVADAMLEVAGSEDILVALGEAFELAHPAVVAAARARVARVLENSAVEVVDDGEEQFIAVSLAEVPERAKDLFPTEELIAGVLPFFLRFVVRLIGVVLSAMSPDEA